MPPVADAKGSSSYLILNPASGSAASLLGSLTAAARELGIKVHMLEAGEDADTLPSRQRRTVRSRSRWPAATGQLPRWPG